MLTFICTLLLTELLTAQGAVEEADGTRPSKRPDRMITGTEYVTHVRTSTDVQQAEENNRTEVEPVKCVDLWPSMLCRDTMKTHGKELCKLDNKFGRYQCCESCAQAFGIKLTNETKFLGTQDFTYYPDCKTLSDAVTGRGVSWTPWCLKWKNEKNKNNCETPLFQQRCQRTCKVRCKYSEDETTEYQENPCGINVDKVCLG
uniref:ShKT domain-containing protein n=1 Tax=Trichuris muris TaxID=70415 RepID=A0A5S6QYV3_TRIMR